MLQAGEYVVPADQAAEGGPYDGPGGSPAIGELHLYEQSDPWAAADLVAWKVRTG
jgi:hypothetical protein